jgi:hypothetical protein
MRWNEDTGAIDGVMCLRTAVRAAVLLCPASLIIISMFIALALIAKISNNGFRPARKCIVPRKNSR